ncbi:MAG: hypothetical protein ACOY0T_23475 [Myxococcota bacterium]
MVIRRRVSSDNGRLSADKRRLKVQTQPNLMYFGRVRAIAAACGALVLSITTLSRAQPASESLEVTGFGTCPEPEAVRAAILQLTSSKSRAALPAESRVSVNDQGASFRVSVVTEGSTAERTYSDPGRSCERRARFAAVFAIVTLMPPDLGPEPEPHQDETKPEPTPPALPPTPPAPPPPPPMPEAAPPGLRLEFAGVAEQALNSSAERTLRGFGIELGAAFGPGALVPAVSIAYAPSRELLFAEARCAVTRAQLAIGSRLRQLAGPFALAAELDAVAALSHVEGSDFVHPASGNTIDLGLRARLGASLSTPRVGPLLAIEASLFPSPSEVRAEPHGTLGRLPVLWLGLALGAELGL